jgi:hypothetical protein
VSSSERREDVLAEIILELLARDHFDQPPATSVLVL